MATIMRGSCLSLPHSSVHHLVNVHLTSSPKIGELGRQPELKEKRDLWINLFNNRIQTSELLLFFVILHPLTFVDQPPLDLLLTYHRQILPILYSLHTKVYPNCFIMHIRSKE